MVLPSTLSMHPVDLLFGETIPQVQCYAVCAAPRELVEVDVRGLIEELLPASFGRLCYELPRRMGLIRELRLASEPAAPVSLVHLDDVVDRVGGLLETGLGERHWHLLLATSDVALVPVLLFDHFLCHGHTARTLLLAVHGRLQAEPPAPLGDPARGRFLELQQALVEQARRAAPWAAYRRIDMPAAPLRELARALGQPFTEAAMLWLARTVHDVAPRERAMEIISFRMEQDSDGVAADPAYGNAGLQALLWEMLPDGFYSAMDPSLGLGNQNLDEFVAFYRRFPLKGALTWLLRRGIEKGKRDHHRLDREKIVLNNLGDSPVPFFRSMFFDPFNDADHLGLVFVDSSQGQLMLQFSPPRRYLERFDWSALERKLDENLVAMKTDPRVRTRSPIRAPSPR